MLKKQKGVSLLEIMLVLGISAAITVSAMEKATADANNSRLKASGVKPVSILSRANIDFTVR